MRTPRPRRIGRLASVLLASTLTVAAGAAVTTLTLGSASAAPQATGEFNYAEALQDSMLFYEIQRSGKLPSDNRVSWRGDSDLTDGADVGLDLTGGYHDAGDEVKFGLPAAYSMTTLAWGGISNAAGYTKSGQMAYLLRNLRWGDDFIIKAHPSPHVFYAQVGTGAADHNFWGAAEVAPTPRASFKVTESCPGSDVVGQSAAALAASSILFKSSDASYAATLLSHAKSLYEFADSYRGTYDACIPDVTAYYKSWSGYWDELVWGAIWLYQATGDQTYLTKATTYYANLGKMNQSTTPKYNYTMSWDDNTFGCYIMLAEITGQQKYIDDAQRNLDWLTVGYGGTKPTYTPGGEVQVDTWGPARYAANAAYTAMEFSRWLKSQGLDATRQKTYHDFAVQQVNYILGDNPNKMSYVVGFTNSGKSTKWPQQPHHRTAHGSWSQSMTEPANTRHIAYGMLVGGPTSGSDNFTDDRQQYQQTEGALDYNSLFSGVVAALADEYGGTALANFPTKEATDGPEMYAGASVNQAGTNFIEIKSQVYNKSAWPARDLVNGHLRYYFTLDSGTSASQVTATLVYHECGSVSIKQFSGSTYYADIDCTGQHIAPAGQSAWHRENQFRITFPAAHDYTKDWSYTGVGAAGTSPVTVNNIAIYDGATKVWGTEPGSTTVTPPSAPGTPVASNVTANAVTLTWTAATAGTNPIGGYDVYRVGTTTAVASTTGTLSATVSGLTASTAYQFYVVARDNAGNAGTKSANVSVTTGPGPTASVSISPTVSTSPSRTTSPSASVVAGCQVSYVPNDWGNGFTVAITVKNTGTSTINGWTLAFSFAGNQTITQGWSATWTQSGKNVTAQNLPWNGSLAPGASTGFGFQATYSGSNAKPAGFTLNGVACASS
jgi:endoglucanase